jgi:hypothetical protein
MDLDYYFYVHFIWKIFVLLFYRYFIPLLFSKGVWLFLSILIIQFQMQDIAGGGCFSLGMLAHFEPTLRSRHAWMYPRLFWEAGLLGQVLYLEAHAVGISATGIGCYFDDPGISSLFPWSSNLSLSTSFFWGSLSMFICFSHVKNVESKVV